MNEFETRMAEETRHDLTRRGDHLYDARVWCERLALMPEELQLEFCYRYWLIYDVTVLP
jgi:hypothetical protein